MDSKEIARSIDQLADAVMKQAEDVQQLRLVGIRRGGVAVAERLIEAMHRTQGLSVPIGTVDISLYRDDAATALPSPKIGPSHVPFGIDGKEVVLVDDVLHTGRTVRAALECLLDYGRPRRVWLAVLCDRGQHELPIAADFIGRTLDVPQGSTVKARFDAPPNDAVVLVEGER